MQDSPNCIQIEFTEGCPLRCTFCGLNGMAPGMKYMTQATATRIGQQIASLGWNCRIEIAMHGEPTANPECATLVRELRTQLPRNYIMMLTNGYGLRENARLKVLELFKAGIDCLGIERYTQTTWADEIKADMVAAGINDQYPELLMEYPACGPEGNPHHREKGWRTVFIAPIDIEKAGTHSCLCNHCGAAAPLNNKQAGKRCARPFREMAIRWDGWVALCCNDFRGEYRIGNVNDMLLGDIWQSPRFEAARKMLYHKQRTFVPCQGCDHRSYRTGLLPDKLGKGTLTEADGIDEILLQDAVKDGPLSVVVKRPWEEKADATVPASEGN